MPKVGRKKKVEPSKGVYATLPLVLHDQVEEKRKIFGYANIPEVIREQVRKWINE